MKRKGRGRPGIVVQVVCDGGYGDARGGGGEVVEASNGVGRVNAYVE